VVFTVTKFLHALVWPLVIAFCFKQLASMTQL